MTEKTEKTEKNEHSARPYIKVLSHVVQGRALELRDMIERLQSLRVEQHNLFPMSEDDLEFWEAIENAGQDHPQKLNPTFMVPAQAKGGEGKLYLAVETRIVHIANSTLWTLRMNEKGRAQASCCLKY
jgi:hypothetical protein